MAKFFSDMLFGLALGIGLALSYALLKLIVWFLSNAAHLPQMP